MAEGAKDQETKPIIFNLFPLQRRSVLVAFSNLSPKENLSAVGEAVSEEKQIFDRTNPHVSSYVSDFVNDMTARGVPSETIDQIAWGVLICYRVLREEAESQGGVLPTFTDEFIEEYHQDQVDNIGRITTEDQLTLKQTGVQLSNKQLLIFEESEPVFSKIVREKLGLTSDELAKQDWKYRGIVELYSLFRKGCSDPKNFSETPNKKIS